MTGQGNQVQALWLCLGKFECQKRFTYRTTNKSCQGTGTLPKESMETFVYGEIVKKMQKFYTLKGRKK